MKNFLLKMFCVGVLIFAVLESSTAQQLSFEYDVAGNQTKREFICVNCMPFAPANTTINKTDFVETTSAKKADITDQKIIAYPNPLTEVLNLKWGIFRTYITGVEVYSTSGLSVFKKTYRYEEDEFSETIPFAKMIPGMYVVKVMFSDGKQELLKVVKQ